MIEFFEKMPSSKTLKLNSINFKKVLKQSVNMLELQLDMRELYLKRLDILTQTNLNDPNVEIPNIRQGDREFKRLVKCLVANLSI